MVRHARNFVIVILAIGGISSYAAAQDRIPWLTGIGEARQQATRTSRLVLLHFWDHNCAPCMRLERSVFNQPEVIRSITSNYVPVKINVSEYRQIAEQYRIEQWPTDVIISADGRELFRSLSQQDPNRFIATLDQVAAYARVNMPINSAPTQMAGAPAIGNTAAQGDRNSTYPPQLQFNNTVGAGSGANSAPSGAVGMRPGEYSSGGAAANRYGGAFGQPPQQATLNPMYADQFSQSAPPSGGSPALEGPALGAPGNQGLQLPNHLDPQPRFDANVPSYDPSGTSAQQPTQRPPLPGQSGFQPPLSGLQQTGPPGSAPSARPPVQPNQPSTAAPPAAGPQGITNQFANSSQPSSQPGQAAAANNPPFALEMHCPVTLVEKHTWVAGDKKFGAIHRGRTYLFATQAEQQRFLASPDKYAPVLSGFDPVAYAEQGTLVDGKREHGVFFHQQVFLFASEANLQRFWSMPDRYAATVADAMRK